jgi:hypothetical protein
MRDAFSQEVGPTRRRKRLPAPNHLDEITPVLATDGGEPGPPT